MYVALGIIVMFGFLAVFAYVKSFFDPSYHPEPTLTAMATAVVGAAITHLIVRRRNGGNNNG